MKPLLVGALNPDGSDPDDALIPSPRGSSGDRLRQIFGLTDLEYLWTFDRANLCTGKWEAKQAQRAAWKLMKDSESDPRRVFVLLGSRVSLTFFLSVAPFQVCGVRRWEDVERYPRDDRRADNRFVDPVFTVVVLPSPSANSREWKEPGSHERARATMRKAGLLW